MRIEMGEPKGWVRQGWGPNEAAATYGYVHCDRCGKLEWLYAPGVKANPEWFAQMVALHNACPPKPGELDPWEGTTP